MNLPVLNSNLLWIIAGTLAALTTGSLFRLLALRGAESDKARQRIDSLKTWWSLTLILFAAILLGRMVCTILFAVLSVLSFREFSQLHLPGVENRPLRWLAYAAIGMGYIEMEFGEFSPELFVRGLIVFVMLSSLLLILQAETSGFVRRIGSLCLGILLTGVGLAHVVRLLHHPPASNPTAGVMGWFLFLVLLTEMNDIAQALIGRKIGRHHITPQVSPGKTWEGFVGGVVCSILLAVLLGYWLTPLEPLGSVLAGAVISLTGFLGDVTFSAVKRDAGVKDSSRLLPGQGGMLDRVDSLTFAAPAFYYLLLFSKDLLLSSAS